jgi:hypothetical protein
MLIADLFFDKKHQTQLRDEGVTVVSLLLAEEIEKLRALFESLKEGAGITERFYTSIWSDNEAHRKAVDAGIKSILFPALQKHLRDIQPVFGNFMVKPTGEDSSLISHQDWSFVDEPQYDSVTVWVPLVDVDATNGNLQIVPGSHKTLQNFIRPRFGDAAYDRAEAAQHLVGIPMKAGEALVLNSRLIHASPPNLSGRERIVASIVLAPAEAQLKHWLQKDEKVEEFNIESSFFWKHSCYDRLETYQA